MSSVICLQTQTPDSSKGCLSPKTMFDQPVGGQKQDTGSSTDLNTTDPICIDRYMFGVYRYGCGSKPCYAKQPLKQTTCLYQSRASQTCRKPNLHSIRTCNFPARCFHEPAELLCLRRTLQTPNARICVSFERQSMFWRVCRLVRQSQKLLRSLQGLDLPQFLSLPTQIKADQLNPKKTKDFGMCGSNCKAVLMAAGQHSNSDKTTRLQDPPTLTLSPALYDRGTLLKQTAIARHKAAKTGDLMEFWLGIFGLADIFSEVFGIYLGKSLTECWRG